MVLLGVVTGVLAFENSVARDGVGEEEEREEREESERMDPSRVCGC